MAVRPVGRAAQAERAAHPVLANAPGPGCVESEIARIADQAAVLRRIGIGADSGQRRSFLDHPAFGFEQRAGIVGRSGQAEPRRAIDPRERALQPPGTEPAQRWQAIAQFDRPAAKLGLEDQVDHAGVGRKAEFKRHRFGQDFDPADRFGREIAQFAEVGHALAVDQHHRHSAAATAAPAPGSGLRTDPRQQFTHRGRAGRLNIGFVEYSDRRFDRIDLAAQGGRGDHYVALQLAFLAATICYNLHCLSGLIGPGSGVCGGPKPHRRGWCGWIGLGNGRRGPQRQGNSDNLAHKLATILPCRLAWGQQLFDTNPALANAPAAGKAR